MIRYNTSYMAKNGLRTLCGPNQSRFFKNTREEAERALCDIMANTDEDRLVEIYGKQSLGTFRVDAFDCYDQGDAKYIYVDESSCLRCGRAHIAGTYVTRPDLQKPDECMPYCPMCPCGAQLRYSKMLYKDSKLGWEWRIL